MVLQHSLMGISLHWRAMTLILFIAKVEIFPPSNAILYHSSAVSLLFIPWIPTF